MAGKKKKQVLTPDGELWYMDPDRAAALSAEIREKAPDYDGEEENKIVEMPGKGKKKNPNAGHRGRLRERFRLNQGFEGFSDTEILELLMTYGSPLRDTKKVAKDLLEVFGSLKCVFEARPEQLMKVEGVGEVQATLISMAMPLSRVCAKCEMASPRQIANRRELENFCKSLLMGRRIEEFHVICVNAQCRIVGQRRIATGSLSEVSAYPRLVMETAIDYNAHSVFFCHNHPGGTCAPSAEDIATTQQLQRLLGGVGIVVLDHMIIAGAETYSMAQHGDLEFGARGRNL